MLENPRPHLELVVQPRIGAQVVQRPEGARLEVFGAEHDSADSRHDGGAGTHGAWLEGRDQRGAIESRAADRLRGGANCQYFGVGGGVTAQLAFVVGRRDDFAIDRNDGTDRYIVVLERPTCFDQRMVHQLGVFHAGHATADAGRRSSVEVDGRPECE